MHLRIFRLPDLGNYEPVIPRSWRNSTDICALADSERHFGHVIKTEQWHAYDAIHSNESSKGFKYLGPFVDLAAAKQAVESAVAQAREIRVMRVANCFAG